MFVCVGALSNLVFSKRHCQNIHAIFKRKFCKWNNIFFLGFRKDTAGYNRQKNEFWEDFKANNKDEYKVLEDRLKAIEVAPAATLPKGDRDLKALNAYKQITHQVRIWDSY